MGEVCTQKGVSFFRWLLCLILCLILQLESLFRLGYFYINVESHLSIFILCFIILSALDQL